MNPFKLMVSWKVKGKANGRDGYDFWSFAL